VAVAAGEHWVKVIGPFMLYVNSGSDAQGLYKDARDQAAKEQQKWPFSWVQGVDYPLGGQRATVQGQLVLSDSVVPSAKMSNVLVGLTAPAYTSSAPGFGGVGRQVDWQQDAKHYQFWVRGTDAGVFRIPDVRAGTYTLHAFADGVLGELVRPGVTVEAGKPLDLGKVVWTPVRRGRPVWEVGIPNRSGSEFFKGDVYYTPNITASYSRLFPQDITYVIGKSEMAKDWFFAHVPYADPNAPAPAAGGGFFMRPVNGRACPRTIVFTLSNKGRGRATLRAAFSGTGVRSIAVAVNDAPVGQFSNLPTDGVLSSHGMHGVWHEQEFVFDGSLLKQGENQVTLTVPAGGVNSGVIYDVLRLELDEAAQPPAAGRPVTPDAAPEAVALLRFFYDLSGRHTLTGQHNYPGDQDRHTLAAAKAWGKTPAVFGKDWGFARQGDKDSAYVRGEIVEELKAQYRNGAIVTMCWHEVPPTADEPVTFQGRRGEPVQGDLNTVQGRLTDAQYKDLLTPGTELHRRWCAQVDAIVPHFKKLEEARVPLLWRPFHEMNGTWFWWGGRKGEHGTAELYKMMFNRLVQHHKIKNLIWVWSVDRPEGTSLRFEECWPGPEYVDILSLDCYSEFKQSYYDDLMRLAAGKPIALAEVGAAPSLEVLAQQPNWTWWMTWAGMAQGRGPEGAAAVRTLVHDPRSWSLSDAEYRKAVAPMRLASNLPADSPVPPSP